MTTKTTKATKEIAKPEAEAVGKPPALADPLTQEAELTRLREELAAKDVRLQEVETRLGKAEQELAERPDLDALGSSTSGGLIREVTTTTTKPTWRFRVKDQRGLFEAKDFKVVDESEAIRLFCVTTKDAQGKTIDPTRHRFSVECLDEKARTQAIREQIQTSTANLAGINVPVGALAPGYQPPLAPPPSHIPPALAGAAPAPVTVPAMVR